MRKSIAVFYQDDTNGVKVKSKFVPMLFKQFQFIFGSPCFLPGKTG